jgi:hypothetical protein
VDRLACQSSSGVEHRFRKAAVTSSNLVSGSNNRLLDFGPGGFFYSCTAESRSLFPLKGGGIPPNSGDKGLTGGSRFRRYHEGMMKALPNFSTLLGTSVLGLSLAFGATANAQLEVATFTLDGVHFENTSTPLTGTFTWTYQPGDFDNGVGQFQDIYVPWWGTNMQDLVFTIDLDSIEITMNGSYHGLGVDIIVRLTSDLNLTTPALVDTVNSTYHIEQGNHRGGMTSGSVHTIDGFSLTSTSVCPSVQLDIADATPYGNVALLYAPSAGNFIVPAGRPCAGRQLGLSAGVSLVIMITADAAGAASLTAQVPAGLCGAVYLQALDLSSCVSSAVVPL